MKKLILLLAVMSLSACGLQTPGSGTKIGQIVRVNHHGVFNKTYEAQIMRGGISNGTGAIGAAFEFTVPDSATAAKLDAFMRNQQEVLVNYRSAGFYWIVTSESQGQFLTSVEEVKKDSTSK